MRITVSDYHTSTFKQMEINLSNDHSSTCSQIKIMESINMTPQSQLDIMKKTKTDTKTSEIIKKYFTHMTLFNIKILDTNDVNTIAYTFTEIKEGVIED